MDEELMKDVDLVVRLNRTMRLLQSRFFKEACADKKLSLPQYTLLAVLGEQGECTMGQLAEPLGITMGAVTSLVDRLIHLGYAARERSTEDRRVVKVRLTPEGRDMLQAVIDRGRKFVVALLKDIKPRDRRTFVRVQQKMVDAFLKKLEGKSGT